MVKVLPPGANVNLNLGKDPMDRLMQSVDLAMKVGSAFQTAQDRRRANASNEMDNLLSMLTNGSQYLSGNDYQKIGNQIKNATNNARSIDSPTLNTQADLLENVHNSMSESNTNYESSLVAFNNDFMNIDIFNQANYTEADGKTVNMEFLDEINNKGIDWFNETQTKLSNYQRSLFNVDKNGNIIPKRNNKAAQDAYANFQKAQNMFYNLYDSRLNNVISEDEYIYIAQNGGLSNQQMDAFRETILQNTTSRINSLERSIVSNNKMTDNLKIKKNTKLSQALKNAGNDPFAYMQEYMDKDSTITQPQLEAALDLTAQDYENGYITNDLGEIENIPEEIARVYDNLISEANNTSLALNTEYDQLKDRFDYWSPFSWDSKNANNILIDKGGVNVPIKEGEYSEELDEDGDGIPDYLQRLATEKTIDKEKDLEEESEEKQRLRKEWDLYTEEQKSNWNNDFNSFYNQATAPAVEAAPEESVKESFLNESQLKQAKPEFEKWQKTLRNTIAVIKREIDTKRTRMNQIFSHSPKTQEARKNSMLQEIKSLENRLAEQEKMLNNTNIDTWFNTIANKGTVKQIKTGMSKAELVQDYWRNK